MADCVQLDDKRINSNPIVPFNADVKVKLIANTGSGPEITGTNDQNVVRYNNNAPKYTHIARLTFEITASPGLLSMINPSFPSDLKIKIGSFNMEVPQMIFGGAKGSIDAENLKANMPSHSLVTVSRPTGSPTQNSVRLEQDFPINYSPEAPIARLPMSMSWKTPNGIEYQLPFKEMLLSPDQKKQAPNLKLGSVKAKPQVTNGCLLAQGKPAGT